MSRGAGQAGDDRRPLYQKTTQLLTNMLRGMKPGAFLPSEPELARRMGVSRATLREAMRGFEERGLIVRRQGVGTYVARPGHVLQSGLEVMESVETIARRLDLDAEMRSLQVAQRTASAEEASLLELQEGAAVTEVCRVMSVDRQSVAYLVDVLPQPLATDLIADGSFTGSILDVLLRRREPRLSYSRAYITACAATTELAGHLGVRRGAPLVSMQACLYDVDGSPVAHTHTYFIPGVFRFHIIRRVS